MQPFFESIQASWLGQTILSTAWFMPAMNTVHALGMTLLLGSIIVMSLRLLGAIMRERPVAEVAAEVWMGSTAGLSIMLITGLLLFIPEATRWYLSVPFRAKMFLLLLATVHHFTGFRKAIKQDRAHKRSGVLALLLWFGVGLGGRAITFLE